MSIGLLLSTCPEYPMSFLPINVNTKRTGRDQRLEEHKTKVNPPHLKTCDNYLQELMESGNTDRNESRQKKHLKESGRETAAQAASLQLLKKNKNLQNELLNNQFAAT